MLQQVGTDGPQGQVSHMKQARMDVAAVQAAVQEQELADRQVRIDALTAEQVEVSKRARSAKNCAQRKARRQQGSPAGD